jgi:hypothetical protein
MSFHSPILPNFAIAIMSGRYTPSQDALPRLANVRGSKLPNSRLNRLDFASSMAQQPRVAR